MARFVVQRILISFLVVLGVSFLVFAILNLTPGDPARLMLGQMAPQEAVDQLNEELGMNKPFLQRYVDYVWKAVTKLDFGRSYTTNEPVFSEIMRAFPKTLTIALFSVFFASIIGVPMGVYSAVKQYSAGDTLLTVTAMFLAAVPAFLLGMILTLVFSLNLKILPNYGSATIKHYILPIVTVTLPAAAALLRLTRSTMLETIRQDYIRTALSKGMPDRQVIFRHALKNALLPIITIMGLSFGGLLGGTILAEETFSIAALGMLEILAIQKKDVHLVMATTIFLAAVFNMIILVVDILYAFIAPRIKARFVKSRRKKAQEALR